MFFSSTANDCIGSMIAFLFIMQRVGIKHIRVEIYRKGVLARYAYCVSTNFHITVLVATCFVYAVVSYEDTGKNCGEGL